MELALLGLIGSGEIRRFDAIHLASLAMVIAVPMLGLAVLARLMLDRDLARRVALPAAAVLLLPAVIRGFLRRARGRVAGTARAMRAPHGVYVVRGDVDHGDHADRALRGTGAVLLDDRTVEVRVRDRWLRLGGHRLNPASAGAAAVRRELEGGPEDGAVRILLAHRPDPRTAGRW